MKNYLILVFILILSASTQIFAQTDDDEKDAACGVERWSIKILTDPDTIHINFNNPVTTTIPLQRSFPTVSSLPSYRMSSETTYYYLDCYIILHKLESDQDYHVVVVSPNRQDTMVTEIADPNCPGIINTSRYQQMTSLRTWFYNTFHPTTSFQYANLHVSLYGVGFYDFPHGQRGMLPNNREIHPVLIMTPVTGIAENNVNKPLNYLLTQNFPNPFNPSTDISYQIPNESYVSLKVYNVQGKEVRSLVSRRQLPGTYTVRFNGADLNSGIYYYKLTANDFTQTKKMILIK
jgi:hypothetical protein